MKGRLYKEFYEELMRVGAPKIFDNFPLTSRPLGTGMGREVYGIKELPLVCKVAVNQLGVFQNNTEAEIWQRYTDKHLASIVYKDSQYLIMERVQPIGYNPMYSTILDLIDSTKIANLASELGNKHNLEINDFLKTASWGVSYDGVYKCYDYGLLMVHRNLAGM